MLDLNLSVESVESTRNSESVLMEKYHYQTQYQQQQFKPNHPEGSGTTSNSSVVNADASSNDDSCFTRAYTLNFDILKVGERGGGGGGAENESENDVVVETKDFFPGGTVCNSTLDLNLMMDLNLSVESVESTRNSESFLMMEKYHYQTQYQQQQFKPNHPEGWGTTSNSSVVNADASSNDDSCSTRAYTFNFDILKVGERAGGGGGGGGAENESENDVVVETKDFFPGGTVCNSTLDLSSDRKLPEKLEQSVGGGEVRVMLPAQPQVKKSRRGPGPRSSQYKGVAFYRRTGRWQSHIWDCGKLVYLGGFDTAHAAARAYDRAAIKFRGVGADINFTLADYEEDMKQMKNLTKEEFVHILRPHPRALVSQEEAQNISR